MFKKFFVISVLSFLSSCIEYNYSPVAHSNNFVLSEIDFTEEFKVGKSCAKLKGIKFDGSRSIIDAAKNGGIKNVVFVDHTETKKLFRKPVYCTVVYGRE
ncbi:MAG: hypothetical protein ISQ32_05955 [Rickettsiales bacterium]|nr:hypothetical protein [Rickettsiales bacterium]